jgi:hypothetical protein
MLTCVIAALWFFVHRFRRGVGLLLTPTELTAKGVFITRSSPWSDVSHVTIRRTPRLYPAATLFSRPELHEWEITSPPMTSDSTHEVGPYLERHGLAHLLRQPSDTATRPLPTTDSLRPYDPVEALRSIRRATVGDHIVRVRALPDGFRAETTDHAGTDVLCKGGTTVHTGGRYRRRDRSGRACSQPDSVRLEHRGGGGVAVAEEEAVGAAQYVVVACSQAATDGQR